MIGYAVILREEGPGQLFIIGLQAWVVLAGLFQRRLHIGATDCTTAGDVGRKLVTRRDDPFVVLEGRVKRSGNTGRGCDVACVDVSQGSTGRQQEQQRRGEE